MLVSTQGLEVQEKFSKACFTRRLLWLGEERRNPESVSKASPSIHWAVQLNFPNSESNLEFFSFLYICYVNNHKALSLGPFQTQLVQGAAHIPHYQCGGQRFHFR